MINREVTPTFLYQDSKATPAPVTLSTATLQMNPSTEYAPYTYLTTSFLQDNIGYNATTLIVVDGNTIYIPSNHTFTQTFLGVAPSITYAQYSTSVFNAITTDLGTGYQVTYDAGDVITIKKLDGTAITVTYSIISELAIDKTDYITSITTSSVDETPFDADVSYFNTGYVWIKSANPTHAYTYTVTVNGTVFSTTQTTTTAATSALSDAIGAHADFTSSYNGSVLKIISPSPIVSLDASDTYGSQASFAWIYEIVSATDLPKNMGFENTVVKVVGSGASSFATHWLKYSGSAWKETKDPAYVSLLDASTMPHILVRNSDDTFTVSPYTEWKDVMVGDIDSNPAASFIQTEENGSPKIRDIFFFKNRLGFITERTVILSEVGEYGNFWRTTTAAVLDSDYIDATVDTTQVISLEYATYLEDSMLLFSDKSQFKLQGGKVLSPKDVQISQTSSYEINTNIRPLFMNNKVFFCSVRGDYTAVMQYEVKSTSTSSEAIDISAHVQTYIPSTVTKLSGSSINNMLFLTSGDTDDTVWVYKYYDNGADRVMSAWFKWTYNGTIYNAFSLGRNLNILIKRSHQLAATDWVIGSGIWDNSKLWNNSKLWVMDSNSLTSVNQLETSPIFPQEYTGNFLDDFTTVDNETIIPTVVRLGEWVQGGKGGKDIRGHLKFKTVQISSEDSSEFNLEVEDVARLTTRTIKSKYTVNRKPMIYGDAKNIRISITNSEEKGFRINTVSYEGALTKRDSRR